jgi:hypothetical protein
MPVNDQRRKEGLKEAGSQRRKEGLKEAGRYPMGFATGNHTPSNCKKYGTVQTYVY